MYSTLCNHMFVYILYAMYIPESVVIQTIISPHMYTINCTYVNYIQIHDDTCIWLIYVDIVANFHLLVQAISHYLLGVSKVTVGLLARCDQATPRHLYWSAGKSVRPQWSEVKRSAGFQGMNQPGFGD